MDGKRHTPPGTTEDTKRALVLATLLHAELRSARFNLTQLVRGDVEFRPTPYGGSTAITLEKTSEKELDALGLLALHKSGGWKQQMLDIDIDVVPLDNGMENTSRRAIFEALLDDLGILCDGHVGHALAPVVGGYGSPIEQRNSPRKPIGVCKSVSLWRYLLVDACLGTPQHTASKVLRWARGAPLVYETRALLGRLNAESSFTLSSGLSVERLPRKSKHLESWLPTTYGVPLTDFLDRSVLRIPCQVDPVLSKPTNDAEQTGRPAIVSWRPLANMETSWPLPPGGLDQLKRALSLVCDVAVETPVIWIDYGDHAHFGQGSSSAYSGSGEPPPRTASESTLTEDELKKALRLQPKLCKLPADVETALHYWLKSKARHPDNADRLVFLRTALEALFLPSGNRSELTYRLATNGAWYTGRNSDQRRQRFNVLRKIYAAASGAVHAGRVNKKDASLLKAGQDICRLAILKRLRVGQAPIWDDIVFGR